MKNDITKLSLATAIVDGMVLPLLELSKGETKAIDSINTKGLLRYENMACGNWFQMIIPIANSVELAQELIAQGFTVLHVHQTIFIFTVDSDQESLRQDLSAYVHSHATKQKLNGSN